METTEDYVKIQRKMVELVQGIINESKELSYELPATYVKGTPVRDYVNGLLSAMGLVDRDISVDVQDSWIGDIVILKFDDVLQYTLMKSEVVRALTYAKLIKLGTGLMDIPDHMYTDAGVLGYLNDISILLQVSPKFHFTDEELDASIEAYKWWGEDTPLYEYIRRAATAYLPSNGYQREAMLTRAFLSYKMLIKMEQDENGEKLSLPVNDAVRVSEGDLGGNN